MAALRSTITRKGQTTIPSAVRKELGLKAGDSLVYNVEKGQIVIKPVKGTLLDAYASVKPKKRPEDFSQVRRKTRSDRAKRRAAGR